MVSLRIVGPLRKFFTQQCLVDGKRRGGTFRCRDNRELHQVRGIARDVQVWHAGSGVRTGLHGTGSRERTAKRGGEV